MTKIFDCSDGTKIKVESSQAWLVSCSCCQCRFVFEMDSLELDFALEVCQLHKNSANLVNDVFDHIRRFNYKFGVSVDLTANQKSEIASDMKTEYDRIKQIGTPEIRADSKTKTQIETDLSSKNR